MDGNVKGHFLGLLIKPCSYWGLDSIKEKASPFWRSTG